MKNKLIKLIVIVLVFVVSACVETDVAPPVGDMSSTDSDSCEMSFELIAGQYHDAGDVVVTNDDEYIYVTFNTADGWVLNETHVFVGAPEDIPVNAAGNPQIGLFPYNNEHDSATTFTVTVPIDPDLECYAVAAHASVSELDDDGNIIGSETAWSEGPEINDGGSWAMYSEYCLLDCDCENDIISYEYYAGQDILVGSLDVTNDDEYLYVTFNFTDDWYMGQTHLYVGSADDIPTNPSNIPVPGAFPYSVTHDPAVQSYTYEIALADLEDCYAIAAHAEVISFDEEGNIIESETGWSFGTEFPDSPRWGWYSEYCTQDCE